MNTTFFKFVFSLALMVVFLFKGTSVSALPPAPSASFSAIDLVVGDIQTLPAKNLTRVSVTNPDIADISDADSDKVSLLAKRSGETVLFLWDDNGKHIINVRVVREDLNMVKSHVQKLLDEANITGVSMQINDDEGKVVMTGNLPKDDKARLDKMLGVYADSTLNFIKEEKNESLIQIDMQIVEISVSLEKNLGIVWGASGSGTTAATSATASSTPGGSASAGATGVSVNYPETMPANTGKYKDLFKIGKFSRSTPISVTLNALIQEGKAKLISKPRLVVISGKQATFLVGGEIPVQNTTSNSTGTSQTTSTSYTHYGVNLSVSPTIREGKIDVVLNVDIRDIDAANSVGGNAAFITRTASTDLLMDNMQTVVLAGLIKYTGSLQVTRVPFLSNIPVVGWLFTNRGMPAPDTKTEMVIILTPVVLNDKKFADSELVMPTPRERNEWQDFDANYEHREFLAPPGQPRALPQPKPVSVVVAKPSASVVKQTAGPAFVKPASVTPVKPSVVPVVPEKPEAPLSAKPDMPVQSEAIMKHEVPEKTQVSEAPVTKAVVPKPEEAPAKPVGAPTVNPTASSNETVAYARRVQEKISNYMGYPPEALQNGWTGTVKISLRVLKDGGLASAEVVSSSGHGVFDNSALEAAHRASPYPPFTAGMSQDELTITLPVVYSRKS